MSLGGHWTREESNQHINSLELKAAFLGLKGFASSLELQHIRLLMDSSTAIAFINKKGDTHSKMLSDLSLLICMVLVFEEEVINICRAHPGGIEWFSRFIIQKAPRFQRLDVESSGFRDSFEEVGSTRCRSVCSLPQYSAEIILQLSSRPRGSGLRCTGSELGGSELLCLSSLCSPGARPAENKTGEGQEGHSNCSELDSSGLVSSLAAVVGRQSSHFTSECGSPQESPRRASPSDTPGFSQSDRLESLRSRGEFKDISTDAFNLICSAWRRGTEKSYSVTWRKWCSWCQDKNINPLSASISDVIEFITSGFQLGLQYSTLNSPRSALSATLPSCEGVPVGQLLSLLDCSKAYLMKDLPYLNTVLHGMLT